jgi:membrane-associated HD superfamily phosphohydrolase
MKTPRFLQSLNRQLTHWRRRYRIFSRKGKLLVGVSQQGKNSTNEATRVILKNIPWHLFPYSDNGNQKKRKIDLRAMTKLVKNRSRIEAVGLGWVHERRSSLVLAIAVVSLTGVMGHRLYNQPKLKVGTLAPQTIKAPYPDKIEDQQKTTDKRKNASKSSTPVLMVDTETTEEINRKLQQLLDEGNSIRNIAGSFPFYDSSVLSVPTQHYLRSCSDAEWQVFLTTIKNTTPPQQSNRFRQNTDKKSTNSTPDTKLIFSLKVS